MSFGLADHVMSWAPYKIYVSGIQEHLDVASPHLTISLLVNVVDIFSGPVTLKGVISQQP